MRRHEGSESAPSPLQLPSPGTTAPGSRVRRAHALFLDASSLDPGTADLVRGFTETQREQLARYRDLLLSWNQQFNLTAIDEPQAVEQLLFLDAVRMLPALDGVVDESAMRLVDVGSGAGFPGLVLKIARPGIDVTLIEATGKKVRFLEAVISDLALPQTRAVHGRAEDFGHDRAFRGNFTVATARAVATLPALIELCFPLLRVGGRGFFPKSRDLGPELAEGKRAARIVGGRIVTSELLPHQPAERVTRLVIADKLETTPKRFPRRAGLPAREPLGRGSS